jgi:hypothetical protein
VNLAEPFSKAADAARHAYDGLNPRERVLVALLGGVFAAILVLLPLYLVMDGVSSMEAENQEIARVLDDLDGARADLERARLERQQALERYDHKAPQLGSFLETAAQREDLQLREVTDQPPLAIGEFSRRQVRASLSNVSLRPVIKMLAAIERSDYPVSTQRIQVDHTRDGDTYNFQIGVNAYDRQQADDEESGAGRGAKAARPGTRRDAP